MASIHAARRRAHAATFDRNRLDTIIAKAKLREAALIARIEDLKAAKAAAIVKFQNIEARLTDAEARLTALETV